MIDYLRRLGKLPLIRTVLKRPAIERIVATINRSSVVDERIAFILREVLHRGSIQTYSLKGSDKQVVIRHNTPDIVTLDEIFFSEDYKLPPYISGLLSDKEDIKFVDLGANVGMFEVYFCNLYPQAQGTIFEPDPENLEVLRRCFEINGLNGRLEVVEACASNTDGVVPFHSGGYTLSRIVNHTPDEEEAQGLIEAPATDVFRYLSAADFVKMDIEGGEWPIITDERFRVTNPLNIVMEYHPHMCPASSPAALALNVLDEAGYTIASHIPKDDGYGVIWACRSQ